MPNRFDDYQLHASRFIHGTPAPQPRKPRRLILFLTVFLPLLLAAEAYVFTQPPVYLSIASVLTTAATDVDQVSTQADQQHVSIQKDLLLGQSILEKTLKQLPGNSNSVPASIAELRNMFGVQQTPETNLLKLTAEGQDPQLLQTAVNTWIAAYQQARAENVTQISEKVTNTLNAELARIDQQVNAKRLELDEFRKQHNISSVDSADNEAHSRLKGLNESLNNAKAEEVAAKAAVDSLHNDLAQGKAVMPEDDSRMLAVLTEQAGLLRERLTDLRGQYTDEYIKMKPALRVVADELAELEGKIAEQIKTGREAAIHEVENRYANARKAVLDIQQQLAAHTKTATDYAIQFEKHQTLQTELLSLETLQKDTRQRLVDIQIKQRDKYPQVEVIDAASLPGKPVRPDYWLEAAIGFAASLIAGLAAVWLRDFLRREEPPALTAHPIDGYLYHQHRQALAENARPQAITLNNTQALGLDAGSRELSHAEITALFKAAEPQTRLLLALLLNGLSIIEILSLGLDNFDTEQANVSLPQTGRKISLNQSTLTLLAATPWKPLEISAADINALISLAAIDSGLYAPEQITADTIGFTYSLFLIRQGVKLSELPKIFGPISPGRLLELGKYSPATAGLELDKITLDYLQQSNEQ